MRERSMPTVSARLSMMRSTPWRLSAPPRAFKNSRASFRASGNALRPRGAEILAQRDLQRRAHRHESLFRSLTGHEDQFLVEVEVAESDADHFGDPGAGAVEELEQRPVTQVTGRRVGNRVEQRGDLVLVQRLGQRAPSTSATSVARSGRSRDSPSTTRYANQPRIDATERAMDVSARCLAT